MSREAAGTTRGDEEECSASIDGLAQVRREHKDKGIKHARRLRRGRTTWNQPALSVRVRACVCVCWGRLGSCDSCDPGEPTDYHQCRSL